MSLKGKRIAILVDNFYEDLEFWYPWYRLKEEGAEVTAIGQRKDTFSSKHGYPAAADLAVDRANAADYDALIIPGGYAPDHMRRCPAMIDFVRAMNNGGRIVAAICHAGWMLASADIVRGKRVTGFFSIQDDLKNAGAKFEDAEVVEDGNLITSRTPKDLPAFSRAIIAALSRARPQARDGAGTSLRGAPKAARGRP